MKTMTHHGKDASGAVSADQEFAALVGRFGLTVSDLVEVGTGAVTGQDTETSPRESERSRRTAPSDAAPAMRSSMIADAGLHEALQPLVEAGLVSRRTRGVLAIYNYTAAAQFAGEWTPALMAARGLIFDESEKRVVARPFPKFFNVGERPETAMDALPWDRPHEITEKVDGSLGVVFWHGGRWDLATRGAFESEQAVYARENLLPRCDLSACPAQVTVLVEIVYPGNRVVVDYGDQAFLSLIAVRDTETGEELRFEEVAGMASLMGMAWTGGLGSIGPAIFEHAPNTEGYVVRWPHSGLRVKVKAPDYVAAHRLLDQVAPRRVLELIREGRADDVRAQLPGHARERFDEVDSDIRGRIDALQIAADVTLRIFGRELSESRKAFALAIQHHPPDVKAMAFRLADGKETWNLACDLVKKTLGEAP